MLKCAAAHLAGATGADLLAQFVLSLPAKLILTWAQLVLNLNGSVLQESLHAVADADGAL